MTTAEELSGANLVCPPVCHLWFVGWCSYCIGYPLGVLVLEPLWRDFRAGQDQPQLLTSLRLPGSRYEVIRNLLLLRLGVEALRRGYAANQGCCY